MLSKYFTFCLLFVFFTGSSLADSRSSEETSRDYLIKKLESMHNKLKSNDFSRKPIMLRLAHILSLRAEDRLAKKYDKNCKKCLSLGTKDAKRSLRLYLKVISIVKSKHPVLYAQSLFQMAYLNRLMGEKSQAIYYLKKIVNLNVKGDFIVRAYFNLGEIYFETYKYKLSYMAFSEVVKRGKTPWQFRSYYYKIWSLYNVSSYEKSIKVLEKFLVSKAFKKGARTALEKSLKKKLQDQLVVIYSQSQVTAQQIKFFYNFKKDDKKENTRVARDQRIFDLAQALNRIGRVRFSNKVWNIYLTKNTLVLNQIRAYISMINNYFIMQDKGWLLQAGKVVEKIFILQKKVAKCPEDVCKNVHKQQKRYIQELHRKSEKNKKLKLYLLSFYRLYNASYSNEFDMLVKPAFLAKELKKYNLAQDLFQESAGVLSVSLKKTSVAKKVKNIKNDLEQVSILQMEVAETSKNKKRKYQAYEFYLKNGTDENLIYKTKYQRAYLTYEDKKYPRASKLFRELALLKLKKTDVKVESMALKSAHLALSSLNFLKNKEAFMADWSGLFLKRFPRDKEMIRINHTALFNRVQTLVSNQDFSSYPIKPSSDKNILKAWKTINSMTVSKLNKEEKIKYYMNKLLLAKEFLKFKEMDKIITQLMSLKSLSKSDYRVALTWKLWLAEVRFDFSETLRLVKVINPKKTTEEYYLQLAHLAELAKTDYISYYQAYIKKYPKSNESFNIVKHIIDKASEKDKKIFLKKYVSYFSKKPDDLSYLVLKLDGQKLNTAFIKFFADLSFMKKSSLNKFLVQKSTIESFNKSYKKVQKFSLKSLSSLSVRRLTQSIKTYKALIDGLEQEAGKSVKLKDWLSQIVAFSGVHAELVRFYESILKLPMPKGLTTEEQVQYAKLMEAQMSPYKNRAVNLKNKINSLLAQNFVDKYKKVFEADEVSRGLLKWEIHQLKLVTENEGRKKIQNILNFMETAGQSKKTIVYGDKSKMLKKIYTELRSKPFNKGYLNKLLKLEKSEKNEVMANYLVDRLRKIKKSKRGRVKL